MSVWSSTSTKPLKSRDGSSGDTLALGVKGRLSNQEMEQLKHKLAQAVAYDHVPESKLTKRHAKPQSKPMTRVYRHSKLEPDPNQRATATFRPGIKPRAAIEYENKFQEGSYDAQRMRPLSKGIGADAKTKLQDEYVTRPREISVIPRTQLTEGVVKQTADQMKTGKRVAPTAIPQVFIL